MISLYGNYRNRKFTDIFPSVEKFKEAYTNCGIPQQLKNVESINTIYYLLYAKYGNSTIASFDENQFIYKVMSTVYMYGPKWEKERELQEQVRDLEGKDLEVASTRIFNHSFNPSTAPSTATLDELTTINDQNVSKTKRGKLEQIAMVMDLLQRDITEEFLNKFKSFFLIIVAPELPLWYVTDDNDNNDNNAEFGPSFCI